MLELDQLKARVEQVRDMLKIQCTDGNWDFSSYMRGLANGLIMAVAVLDDTEPEFKMPDREAQFDAKIEFTQFCEWIETYRGAQVFILDENDEMVVASPRFDLMYEEFQQSWFRCLYTNVGFREVQRNQLRIAQDNLIPSRFRTDWPVRLVSNTCTALVRLSLWVNNIEMKMRKMRPIEVENV